jgi:tRNA 2-selenouridine synthase
MKTIHSSRGGVIVLPSVRPASVLGLPGAVFVDLRSPTEFAVDHIPGARNVALFDDVERALVGTLYRQSSPEAAFEEGRAIARKKIVSLVSLISGIGGLEVPEVELARRVDEMTAGGITGLSTSIVCEPTECAPERPVVLHCWRGGLRSRSVAGLLVGLGLERVVLLEGGYKAYRADVAREIADWRPPRPYVLFGWTGVGKTLVLREIERLRPRWTIDLEALAGHRSSLLGMVGRKPRSQKAFESGLVACLRAGVGDTLVLEGESRKVGDVILPPPLWSAMNGGIALEITASLERRVEVLRSDYLADEASRQELLLQLPRVEERMKRKDGAPTLAALLESGRVEELVHILLEQYYDPLYRHSQRGRRYAATFDAGDPAAAAEHIVDWIESARFG